MQGALFEGPSPRPYHCPDCECRFEASPPPIANSTPVCPRCRGRNPVALSLAGVLGASSDAPSQILTDLLWLVSQIPRAAAAAEAAAPAPRPGVPEAVFDLRKVVVRGLAGGVLVCEIGGGGLPRCPEGRGGARLLAS